MTTTEWEYRIETILGDRTTEEIQYVLTHLGRCGWEAWSIERKATFTAIYLKRKRES